ncbi:MAG: hypothetical protein EZS28_009462 [Streblomastix strix]|uniref:Uncharacterized protein n=1 Tax=Streblomastix strix TaxID=222440 RepID=A0A5J4WK33_9EUKA|nr:MAG: hypothetical protein EZS28_009462 [Streblomastix strix]
MGQVQVSLRMKTQHQEGVIKGDSTYSGQLPKTNPLRSGFWSNHPYGQISFYCESSKEFSYLYIHIAEAPRALILVFTAYRIVFEPNEIGTPEGINSSLIRFLRVAGAKGYTGVRLVFLLFIFLPGFRLLKHGPKDIFLDERRSKQLYHDGLAMIGFSMIVEMRRFLQLPS